MVHDDEIFEQKIKDGALDNLVAKIKGDPDAKPLEDDCDFFAYLDDQIISLLTDWQNDENLTLKSEAVLSLNDKLEEYVKWRINSKAVEYLRCMECGFVASIGTAAACLKCGGELESVNYDERPSELFYALKATLLLFQAVLNYTKFELLEADTNTLTWARGLVDNNNFLCVMKSEVDVMGIIQLLAVYNDESRQVYYRDTAVYAYGFMQGAMKDILHRLWSMKQKAKEEKFVGLTYEQVGHSDVYDLLDNGGCPMSEHFRAFKDKCSALGKRLGLPVRFIERDEISPAEEFDTHDYSNE